MKMTTAESGSSMSLFSFVGMFVRAHTWVKRWRVRMLCQKHDFEVSSNRCTLTSQTAVNTLNTLQSNADAVKKWRETRTQDLSVSLKADMVRYLGYVSVDVSTYHLVMLTFSERGPGEESCACCWYKRERLYLCHH